MFRLCSRLSVLTRHDTIISVGTVLVGFGVWRTSSSIVFGRQSTRRTMIPSCNHRQSTHTRAVVKILNEQTTRRTISHLFHTATHKLWQNRGRKLRSCGWDDIPGLIYIEDYNISCITNKNPTKIQPLLEHDQPTDGQVYKTRKRSWRCQTRVTWKHAKIAPIRRVSFHFTEFHFPKLPMHSFTR